METWRVGGDDQPLLWRWLKATPFKIMYGRDPPTLVMFEQGSTKNFDLEESLIQRDELLKYLKECLLRAQDLMKKQADKHRRDVELVVDDMVYLKLRPYRQRSVSRHFYQKLQPIFMDLTRCWNVLEQPRIS